MKTCYLSDRELIELYLSGEHNCMNELVNRYNKRLYAFIYKQTTDRHLADDIFQETFIKVINALRGGKYVDKGKFISWVMRIANNLLMDHYRERKRIPVFEVRDKTEKYDIVEMLKSSDTNVVDNMITDQIHGDVRKLVDALPPEQKQIVIMRHFSKMSFADIADELNINMNTALGRMRYALVNIRKIMKEKKIVLTLE